MPERPPRLMFMCKNDLNSWANNILFEIEYAMCCQIVAVEWMDVTTILISFFFRFAHFFVLLDFCEIEN